MEQLKTRKFAGIDLCHNCVQLSIFDEESGEMTEESFPLSSEGPGEYIEEGLDMVHMFMETNCLAWEDFGKVTFAMEDPSDENRKRLSDCLSPSFYQVHQVYVLSRFRAFAEYFFRQEKAVYDRNALLLDFGGGKLSCIFVEQIRRAKQKAYRAVYSKVDTAQFEIEEDDPELDVRFCRMIKQFLIKHPIHIVYLTGKGFDGNWMKKTLNYLCAGRRVFFGQNLYAGGACLMGIRPLSFIEEGMVVMQGPMMVRHTIGVISRDSGKPRYVPIASIGKEWYNSGGDMDIILDKSRKVDFFYHNSMENEMESVSCEIRDLPDRPAKTTRIHIHVDFTSETTGVILLTDMGFGQMYPATGKVTIFPFRLIG